MNNANRMRIICDPFKKEIDYQWYDSNIEDYVEFDPENSKLASDEFMNATIQNRAYEILDIINRECNVGNVGLEIIFIGTDDDYSDFCSVISNYYADANIRCIRENRYYNTAGVVLPKIKDEFSTIKATLEEYTEDNIAKLIFKYNDVVKPSISLCMLGLYSAGKSAFINSIIGSEVLPSASDPTTAKVCKICCGKEYQIRFWFDDKECVLTFAGATYKSNSNFEKAIIKELQRIVASEGQHNEIYHMNRALEILNNYASDGHKISDIIEIRMPFTRTALPTEEFDFVIYDTPGSNSDNNLHHFEVLKDSLDEQTNALPIFLTTPDTMDAEDNDKILRLIEDIGTSLDTTNAIVIINKADEKGSIDLGKKRDKCQSLRITKWKSTRIFFVSSIIALASKKDNPDNADEWLNKDMFEIYGDKASRYAADDRKLFEFNIIDKSKSNNIDAYINSDKTTHLYKNSGLESVEKEIVEYARRYALYSKCRQGSIYLQRAIDLCVGNVQESEEEHAKALQKSKELFDSKKRRLCDELEAKKDELTSYTTEFQKVINTDYTQFTKTNRLLDNENKKNGALQKELKRKWKELDEIRKKEKKDKNWAFSQIQSYVEQKYNALLESFAEAVNKDIVSFWTGKSDLFKKGCIKIVHDSDSLTYEQKRILESVVLSTDNMSMYRMKFDLREIGAIKKKKFFIFQGKGETFDFKECSEQFIKYFHDAIRTHINSSVTANALKFKKWTDRLIDMLTQELCKFNSDLNMFSKKIEDLNADIIAKKACERQLIKSKEYIDNLLDVQEVTRDGL